MKNEKNTEQNPVTILNIVIDKLLEIQLQLLRQAYKARSQGDFEVAEIFERHEAQINKLISGDPNSDISADIPPDSITGENKDILQ